MAFGGYKFAGYSIDPSGYTYNSDKCLYIHIARIRAFLDASAIAGRPWKLDKSWLNGSINYDDSTGTIDNYAYDSGNIHRLESSTGSTVGYSTYFKYKKGGVTGYYYIMTTYYYGIDSDTSEYALEIPYNACLLAANEYDALGNSLSGPTNASCFHCLSLDPFGTPDAGDEDRSHLYLLNDNQRATRLSSIGANKIDEYAVSGTSSGFVNLYNSCTCLFGYCIKDKDIISICGYNDNSGYENPFSTNNGINTHVNVLSLEGLSSLYGKDDTYKLLQLDIKNMPQSYGSNSAQSDNGLLGLNNQVLNESGEPLIFASNNNYYKVFIPCDIRTFHDPVNADSTPYSGIPICVKDVSASSNDIPFTNSNQYFKGSTNPELVAMSFSSSELDNDWYTESADGRMLYLNSYEWSTDGVPMIEQNQYGIYYPSWVSGYFNFYIGWDASNPDIRDDLSWPDYGIFPSAYNDAAAPIDTITVYRTNTFEIEGSRYYLEVVESASELYNGCSISNMEGAQMTLQADDSGPSVNVSLVASNFTSNNTYTVWSSDYQGNPLYYISDNYSLTITNSNGNWAGTLNIRLYQEDGTPYDSDITTSEAFDISLEFSEDEAPIPEADMSLRTESFELTPDHDHIKVVENSPYTTLYDINDLVGATIDVEFDQANSETRISCTAYDNSFSGVYTLQASTYGDNVYYLVPNEFIMSLYDSQSNQIGTVNFAFCNSSDYIPNGTQGMSIGALSDVHATIYDPTQTS